jgi:hypothetical protein
MFFTAWFRSRVRSYANYGEHWDGFSPPFPVLPKNFYSTNYSTFLNHLIIDVMYSLSWRHHWITNTRSGLRNTWEGYAKINDFPKRKARKQAWSTQQVELCLLSASSTLKMAAIFLSQTSVHCQRTTWCDIAEARTITTAVRTSNHTKLYIVLLLLLLLLLSS